MFTIQVIIVSLFAAVVVANPITRDTDCATTFSGTLAANTTGRSL